MSDDMSSLSPSSAGEQGVLRSMQEVAMSSQEASKMLRTYNIAWWGNNYQWNYANQGQRRLMANETK